MVLVWGCVLTQHVRHSFSILFPISGVPFPSYPFQPPTLSFRFPVLCPHCIPNLVKDVPKHDWIQFPLNSSWCANLILHNTCADHSPLATHEPDCAFVQQPLSQQTYANDCWYSRMSACSQNTEWCEIATRPKCLGYIPKKDCVYIFIIYI